MSRVTNNFVAVDPGSEGTGVAYYSNTDDPAIVANLSSNHKEWSMKCNEICYKFRAFLMYHNPKYVFCEQPQFFESLTGITAMRSQTPIKLTVLFGRLWEISVSKGIEFIPVKINDWKGQLTKIQTANRVEALLNVRYKTTHETDAVAIGLYIKGMF